ncbi:MAG: TfoX/Sxy family protein [Christensenella sp.]
MATSAEYIEYVCEQIQGVGAVRCKKMFGEYMVYINDKPILLVCDNTVYVKCLDCIADKMKCALSGTPYNGAKLHYILDIDDADFSKDVILALEKVTPLPKPRKAKNSTARKKT